MKYFDPITLLILLALTVTCGVRGHMLEALAFVVATAAHIRGMVEYMWRAQMQDTIDELTDEVIYYQSVEEVERRNQEG